MEAHALEGGFSDPAMQAASVFRAVMEAMARPGTIHTVEGAAPPEPLSPAAGAALLMLCDPDTPIYLAGTFDTAPMREWISFHTGAPLVDAASCMFAVGAWEHLLPLSQYHVGTPEYPDRSATLIVEVPNLSAEGATLKGPGIKDSAALLLPELAAFQQNNALFPLGLDFLFTCDASVAALPRSTEVA